MVNHKGEADLLDAKIQRQDYKMFVVMMTKNLVMVLSMILLKGGNICRCCHVSVQIISLFDIIIKDKIRARVSQSGTVPTKI